MDKINRSEIKIVPISKLKPDPKNARKHVERNLELIQESLKQFGQQKPIIAVKDGTVIAGNGTLAAAKSLKWKSLSVKYFDGTPDQARAYAIADNRSSDLAEWDIENLIASVKQIDGDFEIGFTEDEIRRIAKQISLPLSDGQGDKIPAKPKKPKTKLGEGFILGNHRLVCADSTQDHVFPWILEGGTADIMFTSPPYNAGKSSKLSGNTHIEESFYKNIKDDEKQSEYLKLISKVTALSQKMTRYQFVNMQMLAGNAMAVIEFIHAFRERYCDVLIWDKGHTAPAFAQNVLNSAFEFVWILTSDEKTSRAIRIAPKFRGTFDNVIRGIGPQRFNEFPDINAATMPMDLAVYILQSFAPKKGSVLDPFAGTGTTLIAAERTGRKCFAVEMDPAQCDVIIQRWEKATGKRPGNSKGGKNMGLITGFIKVAVNVVTLPVAIVADVATVGQAKLTEKVVENMKENAEEVGEAMAGNGDFL